MARPGDTKSRALRIDKPYHKKRHTFRKWDRFLTWSLPIIALAWIGYNYQTGDEALYSSGPVSSRHAFFENDCAKCHTTAFTKVQDQACIDCHDGPEHHPEMQMEVDCAACHVEHGGSYALAYISDRHCTMCHEDLKQGKPLEAVPASRFDPKIISFVPDVGVVKGPDGTDNGVEEGHPEVRLMLEAALEKGDKRKKDESRIRLNHMMHMTQAITVRDWRKPQYKVKAPYKTLKGFGVKNDDGSYFIQTRGESKDFPASMVEEITYDPSSSPQTRPIRCVDCHEMDKAGTYMEAINFEKHCRDCHAMPSNEGLAPLLPDSILDAARAAQIENELSLLDVKKWLGSFNEKLVEANKDLAAEKNKKKQKKLKKSVKKIESSLETIKEAIAALEKSRAAGTPLRSKEELEKELKALKTFKDVFADNKSLARVFNRDGSKVILEVPHESFAYIRGYLRMVVRQTVSKYTDKLGFVGTATDAKGDDIKFKFKVGKKSKSYKLLKREALSIDEFVGDQVTQIEQDLYQLNSCTLCHSDKDNLEKPFKVDFAFTEQKLNDKSQGKSFKNYTKADIVPPSIPERWLQHSEFDHAAHRVTSCVSCHMTEKETRFIDWKTIQLKEKDIAEGKDPEKHELDELKKRAKALYGEPSKEDLAAYKTDPKILEKFPNMTDKDLYKGISSKTTDILLPKIGICMECHKPEGGARANCVECHIYHDRSKQRSPDGFMSLSELKTLIKRGARSGWGSTAPVVKDPPKEDPKDDEKKDDEKKDGEKKDGEEPKKDGDAPKDEEKKEEEKKDE